MALLGDFGFDFGTVTFQLRELIHSRNVPRLSHDTETPVAVFLKPEKVK